MDKENNYFPNAAKAMSLYIAAWFSVEEDHFLHFIL